MCIVYLADPIKGPQLLGYSTQQVATGGLDHEWRSLPPHKDEDQVKLDVDRSFVYYPKGP